MCWMEADPTGHDDGLGGGGGEVEEGICLWFK